MFQDQVYKSKNGGVISRQKIGPRSLYQASFDHLSVYCNSLDEAKEQLNKLENLKTKSGKISIEAMKRQGRSFRKLVEAAAAPYLGFGSSKIN